MDDAVWDPRKHVEKWMSKACEDVTDICTILNGLKCGQHRDPDVWTRRHVDEAA